MHRSSQSTYPVGIERKGGCIDHASHRHLAKTPACQSEVLVVAVATILACNLERTT